MLDLVSSNPDAHFWEQLREEAAGVFTTADDWTNPASLPKLPLADSTIREGLRQNPMLTRVILREVMPKDGVTLPSGHHIPKGAWMSAGAVGLHHDDRFYPKPEEFDAFRFAKRNEETLAEADKESLTSVYRKNQGLATASDIYLGFSYGKHAWYVAMADRLSHLCERSANRWQSWSLACCPSAQIGARLHHFKLRYPAHPPASRESGLRRQPHPFSYCYNDGSQEETGMRSMRNPLVPNAGYWLQVPRCILASLR